MARYVTRPCYCTRDDVRRALDVKQAFSNSSAIDRAIVAAADAVDGLTGRRFYTAIETNSFDWPNWQYAYPWNLYLDDKELAGTPTNFVTGSLLPVPIVIPTANYILHPKNQGPPFTWVELRRDLTSAFGSNPTPQLDIAITGPFGYWQQTRPSGNLAAGINASVTLLQVTDSSMIGVGDTLTIDTESMLVTDVSYVDLGAGFLTGITTAQANDNVGSVASGASFDVGEVIQVDFEWMLITNIVGNNLVVKRGYGGSVLATHAGADIWAARDYTVLRGQLGTTAAAHLNAAPLLVADVPGLIRQLAIAESEIWLTQEPGAYSIQVGGLGSGSGMGATFGGLQGNNQVRLSKPGDGIQDLRERVINSKFTRKVRSRVI